MAENNWTIENVNEALQELPALIARQTEIVADKEHDFDKLKHRIEIKRAKEISKLIFKKSVSQRERQALVTLKLEVEEMALIEIKKALRDAQVELKKLCNEFEAVKRFAQLRVAEMRNLE